MFPETIETARLLLRRPRISDAADIFVEYARDVEVTRYMDWKPHANIQDTLEFLPRCDAGWATGREFTWGLTFAGEDRVVGMIAIRPDKYKADIGYVLARRYWGRGLMAEAGKAIVAAALADPQLRRISATCDADNYASARVMEKIGMQREGLLRRWMVHPNISPEPRDALLYAVVR